MFQLPRRQIHLDFHTSPFIPGVAANFDPEAFAQTMAEARVESVTVFAKCHHGMAYYPSKLGPIHPHLGDRDLLGEMIEALHRRGIRAPLYTTVVWEEHVADTHPEWRQMKADGSYCQLTFGADMQTPQPGRWRFNSFAHPDYQDFFEAHLSELLEHYPVDGFFIDILFMHEEGCFNPASQRERSRLGLSADTPENNARFESLMQQAFAERFTRLIRGRAPEASVFYNSTNRAFVDARYGWAPRVARETHNEIESLPNGFWGYFHFPRLARQAMMWPDRPFLGMTGRFQKMWGDFGGLKPQAALEFETFRAQALGGGVSVGDQMYPGGQLDKGAYALIGRVFRQLEAADAFYADTRPCPHGAILLAGNPGCDEILAGQAEEGAVLMAEELHYDVAVLDDAPDFAPYAFLILPDSTPLSPALARKLEAYYETGGRLILSHRAGFAPDGTWALPFLPLTFDGPEPLFPSYWRATSELEPEPSGDCRVIYQQGLRVEGTGTVVLTERIPPYFRRNDLQFCSHFQTPPDLTAEPTAAILGGERFVYCADPVFAEYRQAGNLFIRDTLSAALRWLGLKPVVGEGLDPHVQVYPRRRDNDLHLTLLNFIPSRKSLAIDVIERGLSFAGQTLSLSGAAQVETFPEGETLEQIAKGNFRLPIDASGRLLLRVPDFFER